MQKDKYKEQKRNEEKRVDSSTEYVASENYLISCDLINGKYFLHPGDIYRKAQS